MCFGETGFPAKCQQPLAHAILLCHLPDGTDEGIGRSLPSQIALICNGQLARKKREGCLAFLIHACFVRFCRNTRLDPPKPVQTGIENLCA
jgi:hypothetical protein